MWNIVDENDSSTLPQVEYGYFIKTFELEQGEKWYELSTY